MAAFACLRRSEAASAFAQEGRGHPRLSAPRRSTWVAGTRPSAGPAMTSKQKSVRISTRVAGLYGGRISMIRPGRPEDTGALQSIEQQARSRYAGLAGFEFVCAAPAISADRLTAGETWVTDLMGAPVGFALVQPMDGYLYLANISVAPAAAHRGVGSALLRRVIDRATELGASAVTLATFRAPPWNGPWFRRHGFASMPETDIGRDLRAVLTRHAGFLDMATRETLWHPVVR
jgi:N-acetylglutamate synthase-like GNAT family acetyltransferase